MKRTLTALLALLSMNVFAANIYSTGNTIAQLTAYSNEESIFTNWRSYVQVTPQGGAQWNISGCASHSVAVRNKDQHLIDLLHLAFVHNKQVTFAADTNVPKIDGQYCILRAVIIE